MVDEHYLLSKRDVMRQGQQNRRGRGRGNQGHSGSNNSSSGGSSNSSSNNNNNRKPQNILSKNYESSGPDVKIRGTAQHIAEKYTHLARDAASAGDLVMTENYLQHAEHYIRIIMAAQAAQAQHYASQPQVQPQHQQPQHQQQQPYLPGDGSGNGSAAGHRPQPHMDRQPDIADESPEPFVERESAAPVPQHVEAEPALAGDAAARELPNGRQRRRRRPAGGPEGRANGVAAEVNGNTAQPVIKADLASDDLLG